MKSAMLSALISRYDPMKSGETSPCLLQIAEITTQNHHIITIWLFLKSQFLLVNSTPISASWPAWASSALGFRPSAPLSAWRDEWDIRRFIYWLDTWLMQMPPCFCWCVLDFLTGLSYLCYSLGELLFIFWVLVKCHYILDLFKKKKHIRIDIKPCILPRHVCT